MKNTIKARIAPFGIIVFAVVIGLAMTACPNDNGGNNNNSGNPTVTGVTVTGDLLVYKGETQTFSARVNGTGNPGQGVDWSIVEADKHAQTVINASGVLTVAADETRDTLTVKAVSKANNTKNGILQVSVRDSGAPSPTVSGVTVEPATSTVSKGGSHILTALVSGTNNPPQAVTWSIVGGNHAQTKIEPAVMEGIIVGKLTIAAAETRTTLTVRAASIFDSSKYGEASVSVIGGGGPGPGNIGNTLNLSGRVYTEAGEMGPSYVPFTGSLALTDNGAGGTGSITNGNLSYTIGVPSGTSAFDIGDLIDADMYENLTVTPAGTVQGRVLDLEASGGDYYGPEKNLYTIVDFDEFSYSIIGESVSYVYVASDVTVTGKGKTQTETWDNEIDENTTVTVTHNSTTKDFTLALKAGWNAVYWKFEESGPTDMVPGVLEYFSTATVTLSLSNPALMWVVGYEE